MIIKVHGAGRSTDNITDDELLIIQACAKDQEATLIFVYGADKAKYATLWEELENTCLGGQNNFPRTMDAAYTIGELDKQCKKPAKKLWASSPW